MQVEATDMDADRINRDIEASRFTMLTRQMLRRTSNTKRHMMKACFKIRRSKDSSQFQEGQ